MGHNCIPEKGKTNARNETNILESIDIYRLSQDTIHADKVEERNTAGFKFQITSWLGTVHPLATSWSSASRNIICQQ
jgi:hypothetical protein